MIALLVTVMLCAVLAAGGFYAVQRFAPSLCHDANNELVRISSSITGGLYGLLLAFVVVTAWQNYSNASTQIEDEISALSNVMRDAGGLPEPVRAPVRADTLRYARLVVTREWATLADGDPDLVSREMYERIWGRLYRFEPRTDAQATFFGSVVERMNEVGRARRLRIYSSHSSVPSLLWGLLVVGGVMSVVLLYLYGGGRVRTQAIMIGVVAGFIGFVVFLIFALEHPFGGELRLSTQPYTYFVDQWRGKPL
jgi:Protein of unknown function (DUF4239)